jgi:BlaI family transcriptional regulator, penicillinase repressor
MPRPLPHVTDAEWSVLEVVWEKEPATVRQLADVLYPKGGPSEYATVHKLLERLETKGYVRRGREGGANVVRAAVTREEAVGRQLEALADKTCGGSLQALLSNLVRAKRLTADELRGLLDLVEQLDAEKKAGKPRGGGAPP